MTTFLKLVFSIYAFIKYVICITCGKNQKYLWCTCRVLIFNAIRQWLLVVFFPWYWSSLIRKSDTCIYNWTQWDCRHGKKNIDINSKYTCVRIFSINDQITLQLSCIISKIHIGSPRIFLFHIQQFQTWSTLRSPKLCCKIKGTMNQLMLINPFISECCH